ncbi:MAG: hypothetical protein ACI35W_02485 [Anaeroplasmataceae bacterium]
MEELLSALFELIFEIIFEVIAEVGSIFISNIVTKVQGDNKLKNRIKMIISFIFFGLSITLLILSIIFGKTFLVSLTVGYLLILLILNLFKFLNNNIWKRNYVIIIISWIRRIVHYAFPITLIVLGSMYLTNKDAKIWLIVCSSIALFIYFCIDMYRLIIFTKRRQNKTNITNEIEIDDIEY